MSKKTIVTGIVLVLAIFLGSPAIAGSIDKPIQTEQVNIVQGTLQFGGNVWDGLMDFIGSILEGTDDFERSPKGESFVPEGRYEGYPEWPFDNTNW